MQLAITRYKAARSHPDAEAFAPLVKAGGAEAMSEEEKVIVQGQVQYIAFQKPWRSEQFTALLHILDMVSYDKHFAIASEQHTKGGLPRLRLHGPKISTEAPVSRLPRSCYSEQWVATLDADALSRLKCGPEADLSIPENLKK